MPRQPKRGLEEIIQSETANGFPVPEPGPETKTHDAKTRSYPSREGKVPVQFFLEKDAHRQLKIVSAETDKSHQDILIEALNAWFVVNDLPPIA